jgi:hypothetical protein
MDLSPHPRGFGAPRSAFQHFPGCSQPVLQRYFDGFFGVFFAPGGLAPSCSVFNAANG